MTSFNLFFLAFISFSTPLSAMASEFELRHFGGAGTKIYDGTNEAAWIYKDCKVIIMGTKKTPVMYVAISDSQNTYSFWTHNPSFATGSGGDSVSVSISDAMALVYDSGDGKSKSYKNLVDDSSKPHIVEAKLRASLFDSKLMLVQLAHHDTSTASLANKITCSNLTLRR